MQLWSNAGAAWGAQFDISSGRCYTLGRLVLGDLTQQMGAALADDTHQDIATALHLTLEVL